MWGSRLGFLLHKIALGHPPPKKENLSSPYCKHSFQGHPGKSSSNCSHKFLPLIRKRLKKKKRREKIIIIKDRKACQFNSGPLASSVGRLRKDRVNFQES